MTPERGTAGVDNQDREIAGYQGAGRHVGSRRLESPLHRHGVSAHASVRSMLLPYAAPSIKKRLDYIVCSRQRRYRIHLGGSYGSTGAPP
jgi:hypothetical protein